MFCFKNILKFIIGNYKIQERNIVTWDSCKMKIYLQKNLGQLHLNKRGETALVSIFDWFYKNPMLRYRNLFYYKFL